MVTRIISALVGIPLLLLVTWAGGWVFVAAICLLACMALYELYMVLRSRGMELVKEVAYPCALLLSIGAMTLSGDDLNLLFEAVVFVTVVGSLAFHLVIRTFSHRVSSIGATAFAVLYIGWLFSFFILLRNMRIEGAGWLPIFENDVGCAFLFLAYVTTWACDSASYFVGQKWGRLRIYPMISPGKTLEGAIAGLTSACITGLVFGIWMGMAGVHALILGFVLGFGGQLGDLLESIIKRDLQVKDFGAIIPGHGGVLDRFDSLLINVPLTYFYVLIVLSHP
ncbi:MAG: hypothetical protein AUJ92_12600 [Armatimonadetes bacterium CG2_30_59_28]|nr:phosphatidate cytidylyltransferase [Armatimonadota bacterium]OIO93341.1 MAG: hypothetical protein AUJ92_12600 [Armatimonadetes bacterium CG2_30_59_28]